MDEIPSIEEEFAQLDADLKRIAALPVRTADDHNALMVALEQLRADWEAKGKAMENAPEWRRSLDGAIARAFDEIIAGVRTTMPDGSFRIDPEMVKRAVEPVFQELTDGLRRNLYQKFSKKPPPGAPPIKVDGADVAAILLTVFGPPPKKK